MYPGIKIARRNINNLRYTDDTTLMVESEEDLKSLLMRVKAGSNLSFQKTKIMASGPITSWQVDPYPLYHQASLIKFLIFIHVDVSSVQLLSHVRLFGTPGTAAHQASLSINNSHSLLKLMSIELVMPSNHLILCCPLLFLPSVFPSIKVFSNESTLHNRWPKYWSFSFNISPSNEHPGLISFRIN